MGLNNDAQRAFASALERIAQDPSAAEPQSLLPIFAQMDFDPDHLPAERRDAIRVIAAPVFRRPGEVAVVLTIYGFSRPGERGGIEHYIDRLLEGAERASALLTECTAQGGA